MTARRIRRKAARVLAVAAIALAVEVSAYVRPDAAESGGAGIFPPGEERALSSPLVAPEGHPDAAAVAQERRFNELRRELLDDRAAALNWWLAVVGVFLTMLAVISPIVGFLGFRRFNKIKREARRARDEAQRALEDVRTAHREAKSRTDSIKDMHAQAASNNPAQTKETAQRVRNNPDASTIDKAVATALMYQHQGNVDEAIAMWRSIAHFATEIDADTAARAWFSIGYLYQKGGSERSSNTAISAYDKAIKIKPDLPEAYNNKGNAKSNLGQHQEAIADFNEAIRLNPIFPEAYYNKGVAKSNLGQHTEAIADYDEAIRFKPEYPDAYNNRGVAKYNLGRHAEAIADYDEAIKLRPNNPGAYSNRGEAKIEFGWYQESIDDSDEAIRLNPEFAEAYYNRGVANLRSGRADEARRDLETAVELAEKASDENLLAKARRTLDSIGGSGA